ncbi:hypothetical protein JCGZ_00089 [Jatropha curcas]|uniref:Uncharacterized protein n=1 Tax=Jatropha curcas TaxID=180498 RepID=A0A067L3W5_JATCU|nr:hypothetical protein JCGZ_00089 [Jatropha curcas]
MIPQSTRREEDSIPWCLTGGSSPVAGPPPTPSCTSDRGCRRTKETAATRLLNRGKIATPVTLRSPERKERTEERPRFSVDERGADVAEKSYRGFTRAGSELRVLEAAGQPKIDAGVELQWWHCAIWWRSSLWRNCRLDRSAPGGRRHAGAATRLSTRWNSGGAVAGFARSSNRAEENGRGVRHSPIELVGARSASSSSGVASAGKKRKEKERKEKK